MQNKTGQYVSWNVLPLVSWTFNNPSCVHASKSLEIFARCHVQILCHAWYFEFEIRLLTLWKFESCDVDVLRNCVMFGDHNGKLIIIDALRFQIIATIKAFMNSALNHSKMFLYTWNYSPATPCGNLRSRIKLSSTTRKKKHPKSFGIPVRNDVQCRFRIGSSNMPTKSAVIWARGMLEPFCETSFIWFGSNQVVHPLISTLLLIPFTRAPPGRVHALQASKQARCVT